MGERPNLIVCMCDELRWCEVGCYGHPTIRTPHIDALAAEGTRFETAVSNNPVCMPARSLLVAGQYSRSCCQTLSNAGWPGAGGAPFRVVGFPQWPTGRRKGFPDSTLPEVLREAGYTTAAIGKWHIDAWPDAIGFDHYLIPAHHHANSAQWFCEDGGPVFSPAGYGVDYEADRVAGYLQQRAAADEPFFLYYNISPPHMPLADAPEKYRQMYGRQDVIRRPNVPDGFEPDDWQMLSYLWDYRAYRDHLPYAVKPRDDFDLTDLHALYMGLTTWVDDTVGRMTAALRAAGLDDNTLVVFTSDHGDNFGSHGLMGKGSLNDEGCRVPMCVSGPGVQTGAVSDQVGSLVDLAPTLLGAAGVDMPAHMPGRDLTPVLRGERETLDENVAFIETTARGIAIRTPTHLLGLPYADGPRQLGEAPHQFFDLEADPHEMHSLAETDEQSEIRAALEARLRDWHARTPWLHEK